MLAATIVCSALLVGSSVGVVAQDEAAAFVWSPVPGDAERRPAVEASDLRASGALSVRFGEYLESDAVTMFSTSMRLVNDEGGWTGTARVFGGDEDAQRIQVWELTGEGGYDGLSLFMFVPAGTEQPWGIILPSESIPPVPDLPSE
jgi:hypothetical protein